MGITPGAGVEGADLLTPVAAPDQTAAQHQALFLLCQQTFLLCQGGQAGFPAGSARIRIRLRGQAAPGAGGCAPAAVQAALRLLSDALQRQIGDQLPDKDVGTVKG